MSEAELKIYIWFLCNIVYYFPCNFKPIHWVENAYMFFPSHERAYIVLLQNIFAIFIVVTMKQADLILKNPVNTDEKMQ